MIPHVPADAARRAFESSGGAVNGRSASRRMESLRELAQQLSIEPDPDYKDDWERGFDAGRLAAGRELTKLLREGQA